MKDLTPAEMELLEYKLGLRTNLTLCKTKTDKCDTSCEYCIIKDNRPNCMNK